MGKREKENALSSKIERHLEYFVCSLRPSLFFVKRHTQHKIILSPAFCCAETKSQLLLHIYITHKLPRNNTLLFHILCYSYIQFSTKTSLFFKHSPFVSEAKSQVFGAREKVTKFPVLYCYVYEKYSITFFLILSVLSWNVTADEKSASSFAALCGGNVTK